MMTTIQALVWSGILTLVMLLVASGFCAKVWEPGGAQVAFGNREGMPPALGIAGRADRAAKNQMEAMVLFLALVLAAQVAGKGAQAAYGATIFFWARVAHAIIYTAGIVYLRTAAFAVSLAGEVLILSQLLG